MSNQPPWAYPGSKEYRVPNAELTPLVQARITARRRSTIVTVAAWVAAMAVFIAIGVWYGFTRDLHLSTAETMVTIAPVYLLLWAGAAIAYVLRRRADRRLARALRQRVAHSAAIDLGTVLRGWLAWLIALLYLSGLLVAVLVAAFATAPEDRTAAVVFGCAVALFAMLAARWVADTVRRPVIANDEPSLRADERLRSADLRWALTPYPAALGWVAKSVGTEGTIVAIVLSGYVLVASIVALVWLLAIPRAAGWPQTPATRAVRW